MPSVLKSSRHHNIKERWTGREKKWAQVPVFGYVLTSCSTCFFVHHWIRSDWGIFKKSLSFYGVYFLFLFLLKVYVGVHLILQCQANDLSITSITAISQCSRCSYSALFSLFLSFLLLLWLLMGGTWTWRIKRFTECEHALSLWRQRTNYVRRKHSVKQVNQDADWLGDMTHQLLSGAHLDRKTLASSLAAHLERYKILWSSKSSETAAANDQKLREAANNHHLLTLCCPWISLVLSLL